MVHDDQIMMNPIWLEMEKCEKDQRIPVFSLRKGKLSVDGTIQIPEPEEPEYPKATVIDELKLRTLKKIPKSGILESQVLRIPEPTKDESDDSAPYLPAILLTVDETGMVRLPVMMRHAAYDPNAAVNDLLRAMVTEKIRPSEIHVRTKETFSLLELFCQKAGIKLVWDEDLELLDEAMESLLDRFTDDEEDEEEGDEFGLEDMIQMLETLPDREIQLMPDFLFDQVMGALEMGLLPKALADRMKRIEKKRQK